MRKELDKIYNPRETEDAIYDMWVKGDCFHAEPDDKKEPFTIVIPPPNVTGQLHMGHALDETLQDILIRYKRMRGFSSLWMPGTDHAGIATQIKVEENLRAQGLTRYDLGREKFIEKVWEWKENYGSRIINQLKKLGSSCDWVRERFTMDDEYSKTVREVFVSLYEKGLIYQGNRIINWCPKCTTALSDAEVEYSEQASHLWHIRYPLKDGSGYVTVATTRPETMLGDTAVAVAPDDERYASLVGKTLILPLMGREIPIVADEYVEKEFGTGCVKVTPSHDPNDFEIGKRHNLEQILILDNDAKINENGGKYKGLDRYAARKQIVDDLEAGGFLVKVEDYSHSVGNCYRCSTTVEPMTSKQWFVSMEPLAKPAIAAVREGGVEFVPDRFSKIYINWMENVRDWCISRQLWWGHRIPAFYCQDCGEVTVSREDLTVCPKCGSKNVEQDPDVLDTWFSSALWPFATLGWPKKNPDLDYFYPTSVLVTGYDIIFFWVARMIFSGLEHTGVKPFSTVLIHGLIRDAQGRKMSKSLGNGIDPLEMIEQYGADALRFTLVTGNSPGNDTRFNVERVEASRNFANKIWNATRFVLMNLDIGDIRLPDKLELEDKWILSKYNGVVAEVTDNIERFELGIAASKLYDFIWDSLCDWYIEIIKTRLNDKENHERCEGAQRVLLYVLSNTLKMLHPFMPFLTEAIWQTLPTDEEFIISTLWPEFDEKLAFSTEEADLEVLIGIIRSVRNRRSEMNVPPSKKAAMIVVTDRPVLFRDCDVFIKRLAYADKITVAAEAPADTAGMVVVVNGATRVFIPLSQLIDYEKELERLNREKKKIEADLSKLDSKLNSPGFVSKAPESVVTGERQKRDKLEETLRGIEESIKLYA